MVGAVRQGDGAVAPPAAFLSLEGVTKRYGGAPAVDGLSLSVDRGGCLVLLGPSGCGKTTTLNLVAGFLRPDAGAIWLDGQDITRLPPHRRDMGMVFQDYALFPHMTLRDNVGFGLKMRGLRRAERHSRAEAALATVGLAELAGRHPAQLSGGQRQRVALARALVIRPRLLLFDEPLSNLDAQLREGLRTEIRAVLDQAGTTAVFVTHDQSEALALADRVALLRGGRLEQAGTPADLYDRPATRFAATFIGGCNLLPGRVVGRSGGEVMVALADGQVRAPARPEVTAEQVVLAVRPHRLRLDAAGPVRATLQTVEYLGAQTRLGLRTATGTALVAEVARPPCLARGQQVGLAWDPADAWLLPAA